MRLKPPPPHRDFYSITLERAKDSTHEKKMEMEMDSPPERAPLPPRHRAPGGRPRRDEPNMAPPCLRSCFSLPAASPQAAERQAATSQVQSGGATTPAIALLRMEIPGGDATPGSCHAEGGDRAGRIHGRGGSKARTSAAPRTPGAAPRCARRRRRRRPGEVRGRQAEGGRSGGGARRRAGGGLYGEEAHLG